MELGDRGAETGTAGLQFIILRLFNWYFFHNAKEYCNSIVSIKARNSVFIVRFSRTENMGNWELPVLCVHLLENVDAWHRGPKFAWIHKFRIQMGFATRHMWHNHTIHRNFRYRFMPLDQSIVEPSKRADLREYVIQRIANVDLGQQQHSCS